MGLPVKTTPKQKNQNPPKISPTWYITCGHLFTR